MTRKMIDGSGYVRNLGMANVWNEIPLADYESHMALPSVGQATLLSRELGRVAAKFKPDSLAILGAAGGNGLERPELNHIRRVIALDVNAKYLDVCAGRYAKRFKSFVPVTHDLNCGRPTFKPVDLIFAALIFEYVRWQDVVQMLPSLLTAHGILAFVLQLPNRNTPVISRSPYVRLERLHASFNHVNSRELAERLSQVGFRRRETRKVSLGSGKSFHIGVYEIGF